MTTEQAKKLVPKFFGKTAKSYENVVFWTTLGRDNYWKKQILKEISQVDSVLDLACGTGILTRLISDAHPNAKIIGVDIMQNYLDVAKTNSLSYKNITFLHQDAEKLDLDLKFDCITSSYLPKYCDVDILIEKCLKHLKDGGKIILHDFTYPKNRLVQNLWNLYFVLLNFLGVFFPNWKYVFNELPKLIRSTTWVDDYKKVMKENDLQIELRYLTLGSSVILVGKKIL